MSDGRWEGYGLLIGKVDKKQGQSKETDPFFFSQVCIYLSIEEEDTEEDDVR